MPIEEISNYLLRYVRTVFVRNHDGRLEFLGSGFAVCEEDRYFFVTAAHVMDAFSQETPLFFDNGEGRPLSPIQGTEYSIRAGENSAEEYVDAAVIELDAKSSAGIDKSICIGLDDFDLDNTCDKASGFLAVGCPETMNRKSIDRNASAILPVAYTLFTVEAETEKYGQLDVNADDHIVLHWNKKAAYSERQQKRAGPNLNGLSGTPIWGAGRETPRIVGILTEHHQRDVKAIVGVRAIRIGAAISALTIGSKRVRKRRSRFRTRLNRLVMLLRGTSMASRLGAAVIALVMGLSFLAAGQDANADRAFRSEVAEISFRYPAGWVEKQPQLHSTVILLYATDGSEATCNVNSGVFEKLAGLSEQQLNNYRRANHTREYYEKQYKDQFENLKIANYWRGYLGQKDAGFAEYTYTLYVSESKIPVTAYVGATFANARRYVLTCNAPTGKQRSAKAAFEHMRNTMIFMH